MNFVCSPLPTVVFVFFQFRRFQTELEDEFGDDVKVTGESTPGITGYFEVTVGDKLVHSKKNGNGFVDSKEKLDKVIAAVNAALKA